MFREDRTAAEGMLLWWHAVRGEPRRVKYYALWESFQKNLTCEKNMLDFNKRMCQITGGNCCVVKGGRKTMKRAMSHLS